jgi:hypothetical protein
LFVFAPQPFWPHVVCLSSAWQPPTHVPPSQTLPLPQVTPQPPQCSFVPSGLQLPSPAQSCVPAGQTHWPFWHVLAPEHGLDTLQRHLPFPEHLCEQHCRSRVQESPAGRHVSLVALVVTVPARSGASGVAS